MRTHSHTTSTNADSFRRVEVITGVGRRRRWSLEDKARIVAESLDPATTSSAVARRYGLHASQLFVWRQQLQRSALSAETVRGPGFVPVLLAEDSAPPAEAWAGWRMRSARRWRGSASTGCHAARPTRDRTSRPFASRSLPPPGGQAADHVPDPAHLREAEKAEPLGLARPARTRHDLAEQEVAAPVRAIGAFERVEGLGWKGLSLAEREQVHDQEPPVRD